MKPFRFIHSSDLHLDSQFKGRSSGMPEEILHLLRESTFLAYENIINLCLEENVDALLIAGDVYDGAERSFKAQTRFISGLERLNAHDIRAFICHGNHDPLNGWQASLDFPPNCIRYGATAETYPLFEGDDSTIFVHGISYPKREVRNNLVPEFPPKVDSAFNIGLIHANVGANPDHDPYAPCEIADLRQTEYDYWALGHVHTRDVLNEEHPAIIYPGNTQGRQINESGPRGVYLIDVDEDLSISRKFLPTDVVRWESFSVDASDMERLQVLQNEIYHSLERLLHETEGRPLIVRIVVHGATPLHAELSREQDMDEFREALNAEWGNRDPFAWCEKLEIATGPAINRDQMAAATDFIGELLTLTDQIQSDESELSELLEEVTDIYAPGTKVGKYLRLYTPTSDDLPELILGAEKIYLSHLLGGDDE